MRPCTGRHSLGQSKVWRLGDFPEILAQHRGLSDIQCVEPEKLTLEKFGARTAAPFAVGVGCLSVQGRIGPLQGVHFPNAWFGKYVSLRRMLNLLHSHNYG